MTQIEPWEPEETVGKLWHAFASRLDAPQDHSQAVVELAELSGRLAVFFRALGGAPSIEIRAVAPETSQHRLRFLRRLGTATEQTPRASFDGEVLRLPEAIAIFPDRETNAAFYLWLVASLAHAPAHKAENDPLRADLRALKAAHHMTTETLAAAPGLRDLYTALCAAVLQQRQNNPLPRDEAGVEAVIRHLLGDPTELNPRAKTLKEAIETNDLSQHTAPRGYRPFQPVPLWPDLRPLERSARTEMDSHDSDGSAQEASDRTHRARRRKADQAERKDSLILHKFEAILSWTEFLNLNRRVDDDDPDGAKKAADDQEEIGLGQISKAPATKLKLHLDLAPEDVDRERVSGVRTYPEWDVRRGVYHPDHVRVLSSLAEPDDSVPSFRKDPHAMRRIQHVKRQFEALRPGRISTPGHLEGEELDMEAAVRTRVDHLAHGTGSNRIWRQSRPIARDLAVSILLDVSRSTESVVHTRAVIDIEREALAALAWGLDACGDDCAIHAFSSLKRDRVYIQTCKDFTEPMSDLIERRIGALRPGFYTRLGAAIRHCSADLAGQTRRRRLLLVITDGKPNDLDHYEGRHGIEDTAMAVREARRMGQAVFGITVDKGAKSWFARMFGPGGFHVIRRPDSLTQALPIIYRNLIGV